MFKLFKKNHQFDLMAPVSGELVPIKTVSDDVFAQEVLGVGYAFKPNDDNFYSPISGIVESVFPTKHAISLRTDTGIEVLLHLGIDTVALGGVPFDILVTPGQRVHAGDNLGIMNRVKVKEAGKDDTIIVVFTNRDLVKKFPVGHERIVQHGVSIGQVTIN